MRQQYVGGFVRFMLRVPEDVSRPTRSEGHRNIWLEAKMHATLQHNSCMFQHLAHTRLEAEADPQDVTLIVASQCWEAIPNMHVTCNYPAYIHTTYYCHMHRW